MSEPTELEPGEFLIVQTPRSYTITLCGTIKLTKEGADVLREVFTHG